MGTPLPPFTEADVACECFGSGTGNGLKTPKYIRVRVDNMEPGGLWNSALESVNNKTYQMQQRFAHSCTWLLVINGLTVQLAMGGGGPFFFEMSFGVFGDVFRSNENSPCISSFTGVIGPPANRYFIGGTAVLDFGEERS